MKNLFLISLFLITSTVFAGVNDSGPENTSTSFMDKTFFTGNLGLSFGSSTNVLISPGIGYRITNKLGAGVGYSYGFNSDESSSQKLSSKVHGPRTFLIYKILPSFYTTTKFEYLKQKITSTNLLSGFEQELNRDSEAWYVGAGYRMGGNGLGFGIEALYDILHDEQDSFSSEALSFQGGVSYGF